MKIELKSVSSDCGDVWWLRIRGNPDPVTLLENLEIDRKFENQDDALLVATLWLENFMLKNCEKESGK